MTLKAVIFQDPFCAGRATIWSGNSSKRTNAMKYSAPKIINCLNAKYAIQSVKEPAIPGDFTDPQFRTVSAYHSDE
jgi:hypothetical protein